MRLYINGVAADRCVSHSSVACGPRDVWCIATELNRGSASHSQKWDSRIFIYMIQTNDLLNFSHLTDLIS